MNKEGVVEAVYDGKKIQIEGKKYSAFDGKQAGVDKVQVGDKVSFRYKDNESNGITYHNIQGVVTVMSGGGSAAPAASVGAGINLSRERAIIRQNALTNAVNFVIADTLEGKDIDPNDVIKLAMYFEKYTSGDIDQEAMASMGES